MDEATLKTLLETTGYPVAYHHFSAPPELPYIVYLFDYTENFGADNKVYKEISNYLVELYADSKDPDAEKSIEDIFAANEIFWEKTENWIDTENLYQVAYQI